MIYLKTNMAEEKTKEENFQKGKPFMQFYLLLYSIIIMIQFNITFNSYCVNWICHVRSVGLILIDC